MSLAGDRGASNAVDPQLKQFIELVASNEKFQGFVHDLTDICWDTCMDKPSPRLETKTKSCMTNCVERFIDTTNFITNRMQRVSMEAAANGNWE